MGKKKRKKKYEISKAGTDIRPIIQLERRGMNRKPGDVLLYESRIAKLVVRLTKTASLLLALDSYESVERNVWELKLGPSTGIDVVGSRG